MKHHAKRASIKDVAAFAGVSLGSVSRVLNKAGNVGDEVRARVERAMRELDYSPDQTAQALRSRSSRTVGCMFTDVANPLYARLYQTFETKLHQAGYMVLLANSLNDLQREREILAMFQSRRMDGAIVAPGNERDPALLETMDRLGLPVVVLDRDMDVAHDRVLFDHLRGLHDAVQHLGALQHRDVALLIADVPNRPMRRRLEGFQAGLAAAGLAFRPERVVRLGASTSPAYDDVLQLLRPADRPTALIVPGTSVLADALHAIAALGLQVPRDVSIVSLGDPDFARHQRPAITSIAIDHEIAAQAGVDMLLKRMRGDPPAQPREALAPARFVARASTGPAPTPPLRRARNPLA